MAILGLGAPELAAILAGAAWRAVHAHRQVAEHRRSWQDDRQLETQQEARDAMSALATAILMGQRIIIFFIPFSDPAPGWPVALASSPRGAGENC